MKTTRREFLKKSLQGTLAAIWGTAAAKGIKLPEVEEESAIEQGGASIWDDPLIHLTDEIVCPHPDDFGKFIVVGQVNNLGYSSYEEWLEASGYKERK